MAHEERSTTSGSTAYNGPTSPSSERAGAGISKTNCRWKMTPRDKAILEQVYEHRSTPSAEIRNALALQLGVLPRQVQVWFQNKRQRSLSKRDTKALNVINATPSTVQAVTPVGLAIHASAVPGPSAVTPEAQSSAAQTRAVDVSLLQADPSEVQPVPLQTHTIDVPTASIPHAMRRNSTSDSLTDLAEVAERVGSIEHLTGGLERVSSLKDIAEFSRVGSFGDLGSLSRIGSLADFSSLTS